MHLHRYTFSVVCTKNTIKSLTWYFYVNGPIRLYRYFYDIIVIILAVTGFAFLADANGDNHLTGDILMKLDTAGKYVTRQYGRTSLIPQKSL